MLPAEPTRPERAADDTTPRLDSYWPAPPPPQPRAGPSHMARTIVRAVWSLLLLALVVIGWPAALAAGIGWPLPDHVPRSREILTWLGQPQLIGVHGVVDLAACVLWLLWAATLAAILTEITARIRRLRPPRLR